MEQVRQKCKTIFATCTLFAGFNHLLSQNPYMMNSGGPTPLTDTQNHSLPPTPDTLVYHTSHAIPTAPSRQTHQPPKKTPSRHPGLPPVLPRCYSPRPVARPSVLVALLRLRGAHLQSMDPPALRAEELGDALGAATGHRQLRSPKAFERSHSSGGDGLWGRRGPRGTPRGTCL